MDAPPNLDDYSTINSHIGWLLWCESKAKQTIIQVRLLLNRTNFAVCFCSLFPSMIVIDNLLYMPLYLQVMGSSTANAGLKILLSPVGVSIFCIGARYLIKWIGRYKGLSAMGQIMLVLGTIFLVLQGQR
jgi:hypothetical protein